MHERERLLRRLGQELQRGADPEQLRRRLRLRREHWRALVDELRTTSAGPALPLPEACACEGTGTRADALLAVAREVAALRPEARWEIDQVHTSAEDLARRAALLLELGDVEGRDVLFVGDDDFCSLMLCAVGRPRRVVVLDIDPRILTRLSEVARREGWPLETVEFDLERLPAEGLPPALTGAFDTFVTDPPYSEAGMLLFCAAGLAALKPVSGVAGYVAVPWLAREEWSDELLFKVQRAFVQQGFFVSDARRAFHAYEHQDGVYSTFLRMEALLPEREPRALLSQWQPRKLYSSRRWLKEGT
ncbi:bis-aminopropyl spermidine synthase family protein [Myxococcaceae bacterium GXIMD 01537]